MDHREIDAIRALLGAKPRPVGWAERRRRIDEVGSVWPVADDIVLDPVEADPRGTGLRGDNEYLAALDRHLTAAARGEISAAEAMKRTTSDWEAITKRIGRTAQIRDRQALRAAPGGGR